MRELILETYFVHPTMNSDINTIIKQNNKKSETYNDSSTRPHKSTNFEGSEKDIFGRNLCLSGLTWKWYLTSPYWALNKCVWPDKIFFFFFYKFSLNEGFTYFSLKILWTNTEHAPQLNLSTRPMFLLPASYCTTPWQKCSTL